MKLDELREAVREEWRRMHHNASISHYYPEFQNEYESDLFWDVLRDDVSMQIDCLAEGIKEDFGESLTFYQYGRQGATIAPHEWMRSVGGNGFGPLREEILDFGSGIEAINRAKKVLAILKRINKYWADTAAYIPEWWKEAKEANGWQADIDAHDGKTSVMRKVWVDKTTAK